MANWCSNSAVVYGSYDEVSSFKIKFILADYLSSLKISSRSSLCQLFLVHGYPDDEKKLVEIGLIAGSLCGCDPKIKFHSDKNVYYFNFSFETAWQPMIEGLRHICFTKYKNLKCEILAEECGCGIYFNTDSPHIFFPEKYVIDDPDASVEYFCDEKSLVDYVSSVYGFHIEDVNSLSDDECIDIDSSRSINFHRFVAC